MSNRIEITDFTAPELDVYARIPEVQLLRYYEPKPGLFIAESPKVIQRAANAGYQPVSFLVQHKDLEKEGKELLQKFPGIPVYHSKDLKHWELYTHILTDDEAVDLKKLPSAKGIWAPCLTYCEEEDMFYVVYGVMNSMNARYFDVDNFLVKSKDIKGPWSKPVYLHSSGFDASILHDDDGKKYIVSLEWETREGYEKPGFI